jgi:sensor histidine kinase YesM
MKIKRLGINGLQAIAWIMISTLFFFERITHFRSITAVALSTLNSVFSLALVIYGYAFFIHRYLYQKVSISLFVLINVFFLAAIVIVRILAQYYIIYPLNDSAYSSRPQIAYDVISVFIAFIIGVLLKSVLDNQKQVTVEARLKQKQVETELRSLQAQVQPHFLFNSLNNIYYEAINKSPKTAELIEKLALMMRFLLEEANKECVSLEKEMEFIKNYIALENIRLHNQISISLNDLSAGDIQIPPMTLIPFIENLFKHGIDRKSSGNYARITLAVENNYLSYCVVNRISSYVRVNVNGSGLQNLRQRLYLMYGERYQLKTYIENGQFVARLKIPVG